MRGVKYLLSAGAVCALSLASVAYATVVVPVSVDEMSREAAAVVRAKVVSQQSAWDDAHRRIHTYTELQVLERIQGEVEGTVVIRTLGGSGGDVGMKVSGTTRFDVGEEVVVFLSQDRLQSGQFNVIGMSQGKYRVDRSVEPAMAVPDAHGLAYAKPSGGTIKVDRHEHPNQIALATLLAQVRTALQTPKAPAVTPKAPGVIIQQKGTQ